MERVSRGLPVSCEFTRVNWPWVIWPELNHRLIAAGIEGTFFPSITHANRLSESRPHERVAITRKQKTPHPTNHARPSHDCFNPGPRSAGCLFLFFLPQSTRGSSLICCCHCGKALASKRQGLGGSLCSVFRTFQFQKRCAVHQKK